MIKFIDHHLNQINIYRLALYSLIFLLALALPLSFLKLLPFTPLGLVYSVLILITTSWTVNHLFAWIFKIKPKKESAYITALILALIITPDFSSGFWSYTLFIFWAASWSVASKYIFNFKGKHIFNPAALGVVITSVFLGQAASWWVGTLYLLPAVILTGYLIIRRIHRWDLVVGFLSSALLLIGMFSLLKKTAPLENIQTTLLNSALLFFTFFMLSEPITMPIGKLRVLYGVLVGIFFIPLVHIGQIYFTPELALIIGNLFSFWINRRYSDLKSKCPHFDLR